MRQVLPGIKSISYVSCDSLPYHITTKAIVGMPIGIFDKGTTVHFVGLPKVDVDESFDNNSQLQKATLQFNTTDEMPTNRHLAFLIETVNGERYVMGAREIPYPVVKIAFSTGKPSGESAAAEVEVTFVARKALAKCVF